MPCTLADLQRYARLRRSELKLHRRVPREPFTHVPPRLARRARTPLQLALASHGHAHSLA
eukprot:3716528-Rhodomonas_salina.2